MLVLCVFVEVCSQPADRGPCKASRARYYFDRDHDLCRPFVFGGCLGNGNNFMTVEECQLWCLGSTSGIQHVLLETSMNTF